MASEELQQAACNPMGWHECHQEGALAAAAMIRQMVDALNRDDMTAAEDALIRLDMTRKYGPQDLLPAFRPHATPQPADLDAIALALQLKDGTADRIREVFMDARKACDAWRLSRAKGDQTELFGAMRAVAAKLLT